MGPHQYELISIIREYHLDFRFPKWEDTLFMLEQGLYPDDLSELLLPEAREDAKRVADQGNFLWRAPTEDELYANGKPDIEIGNLLEGNQQRMGIRYQDRPRNILIIGSAGMGKTVCARNICLEIDKSNQLHPDNPTSFIIEDPKVDYPDLVQKLAGPVVPVSIHDNLRAGLNGPVDVPPNIWIGKLSVSIAARIGLIMSRTSLARLIRRLLVALNPWLKEEDLNDPACSRELVWPSLSMVLEAMKMKDVLGVFASKASYGETLIQAWEGLLQDSGKVFDCSNGLDINDIIRQKKHCIMDLSNTEAHVFRLLCDIFHNQVLVSRLHNKYKCDHTDVYFVADEGDLLVEAKREEAFPDGMSPSSKINRLGREMGIGTIFLISALQKAGEHILRNACYSFVFNLSDSESVHAACLHLQLDPRCERMLSSLPPGQCIFRQTAASWTSAMWCNVDYVAPARNIGHIKYEPHPHVPAISLAEAPHVVEDLNAAVREYERMAERQGKTQDTELLQQAMEFLRLSAEKPYAPCARLFKKLGDIRFEKQVSIRQILKDEELAEFQEERIGRANVLMMEITNKGFEALGLPIPNENRGRGSIAHRHFAHWIKFYYQKQGYKAYLEHTIEGTNHAADVAVLLNNKWRIYEICLTAVKNVLPHIKACFESTANIERLIIVTATKTELKDLKKTVQSDLIFTAYADRIAFDVIENYMMKR